MTVGNAFSDGCSRVRRAPTLVAGLWLTSFLLAWPLALTLRGQLAAHLGSSLAADSAAAGVNFDWWNEFLAQAVGVGQTFVPAILGFAAVLKNVGALADAQRVPPVILAVLSAHILMSMFVTGGVLDRLARDRRIGSYGFFAACGLYFFRFLRLAVIAAPVYWWLFIVVHAWLFDELYPRVTRDVTVERTALMYRVLLYAVFGVIVAAVNVLFDYAKVRMVVEDRRSAIGALTSATRFLIGNTRAAAALYFLDVLIFLLVVAAYGVVVPGAGGGITAWLGFLIGQLYIALRVSVRLLFAATEIALFQSRLAHAGYTAAPIPVWPDSPAAEAILPE